MNAAAPNAGRHAVRVGLKLAQGASIETLKRFWQAAEAGGFDHCWAFDHLVTIDSSGAPRLLFDGWSLLAAMAASTSRIRMGLLVSGIAYRHPALLAKAAVTVDHLSGGRLEFGIGAGWAEREHALYGIDITQPVSRFAEAIEVVKLLWSGEVANYEGQHYQLRDAVASPSPVQTPHPPIWIGADGPRMLALAARHADVWNPANGEFEAAVAAGRRLSDACRASGRDPEEIRWSTHIQFDGNDPNALADEARRWVGAHFSELILYCVGRDPVAAAELAGRVLLPQLRELKTGPRPRL